MVSLVIILFAFSDSLHRSCGRPNTPLHQNQNHWQLITLALSILCVCVMFMCLCVCVRSRPSDLSCFWKCYILLIFPIPVGELKASPAAGPEKGMCICFLPMKTAPHPSCLSHATWTQQTGRQNNLTRVTDWSDLWLLNSDRNSSKTIFVTVILVSIYTFHVYLLLVVNLQNRKEMRMQL